MAKKIIGRTSPLERAPKGLVGIILRKVFARDGFSRARPAASPMAPRSKPKPG